MSHSANKNRHQKIDKRLGHKQARQATRQILNGGGVTTVVHGSHWSPTIEQPPISDEAVTGSTKGKKSGKRYCKRNKYGPHLVGLNPRARTNRWYYCDYACLRCGKGFYSFPKGAERATSQTFTHNDFDPADRDPFDHWSLFNIKMRLLGLRCYCGRCQGKD